MLRRVRASTASPAGGPRSEEDLRARLRRDVRAGVPHERAGPARGRTGASAGGLHDAPRLARRARSARPRSRAAAVRRRGACAGWRRGTAALLGRPRRGGAPIRSSGLRGVAAQARGGPEEVPQPGASGTAQGVSRDPDRGDLRRGDFSRAARTGGADRRARGLARLGVPCARPELHVPCASHVDSTGDRLIGTDRIVLASRPPERAEGLARCRRWSSWFSSPPWP